MDDTEFKCLEKITNYLKVYKNLENESNIDNVTPCRILNSFTNSNMYTRAYSKDVFGNELKIVNYLKNDKTCWSYGNTPNEKLNDKYFLKTLNFIEREMILYKPELLGKFDD